MAAQRSPFRIKLEQLLARLGFGMRAKLIAIFIIIKVVPLVLIALVAWRQSWRLGEDLKSRTREISAKAVHALAETGKIAVADAVQALDARATDEIERMSTDAAHRVANFLYARDDDILLAASLEPDEEAYRKFLTGRTGRLVQPSRWELSPDGKSWVQADPPPPQPIIASSIEENNHSFHYRPPERFEHVSRPLYLEMTFIDLDGREKVKATTSPHMDPALKNVSARKNTYVKAETYFQDLKGLKPGGIYVSDVIGEYVGSRLIGMYTPENAAKKGLPYEPEKDAYAGMENPNGRRFKGLVRWVTPVVRDGQKIGYVTLALDHDHIMEFTDHLIPTRQRYTELPDAYEGNYAFIWDHKGRSIAHPRHHSITGYDPETGDPQVPWLENDIYNAWQASGLPYAEFIANQPTFVEQSNSKKPASALTAQGLVGLDCRYLNFAPQCTGWFDLTKDGGSGSFLILWSGLWKLNTAAAIPYYTGQYGNSLRGFGFVAVGAGLADFHRPATETQRVLNTLVEDTDRELDVISKDTYLAIGRNLWETATSLTASTVVMAALVMLVAVWMASFFTGNITRLIKGISRFRSGERQFRFNEPVKDEIGALADSFDEMADSIVGSVKGPLTIVSLERKILYMNEQSLKLVGTTLDEVVGRPYAENTIFPSGVRYCPIDALLEGHEADVLHHEASGQYFKGNASYLRDKDGGIIGYVITTSNVTDLIEEQKRIEQQRALLDTIFSSSPDLIWYQDADETFLAANPRFASVAGGKSGEISGCTPDAIFSPERANRFKLKNRQARNAGIPLYSEEVLDFADGHREIVDTVRTPLYNARGQFIGLLGVARDVSRRVHIENELRSTQQELKKAAAEANRANESKSAFLARMSHEIRTPMNAIIGMTNIVKRKLEKKDHPLDDVKDHVRQIEVSSQHLLGLLNDILDISKIEAGKIELSEEPFDLPRLIANVASIIQPRCAEKNISFTVRTGELAAPRFRADALRLRQVLINLLGNAVKFTPECGQVDFLVEQKAQAYGKSLLQFTIADTGIGIPSETLTNLFQPFEQGGGHINRRYGGTGLGLSISRSIVKLMGSDISVKSEEGKGSEFSFAVWLYEDNSEAEQKTDASGDLSCLRGKRVLLVDDVAVNRIIVMEQLSGLDLEMDEAGDGLEALEKFRASEPGYYDIILMDVQMPNLDGYSASRAIRLEPRPDAETLPIIAMTANAFKEDVDEALANGMNNHLAKPLERERLLEVLAEFLGTRTAGRGPKVRGSDKA